MLETSSEEKGSTICGMKTPLISQINGSPFLLSRGGSYSHGSSDAGLVGSIAMVGNAHGTMGSHSVAGSVEY